VGGSLDGQFGDYPDEGLAAVAALAEDGYQHVEPVTPSGSDQAESYILRQDAGSWIWDYAGPAAD